MLALLAHLTGGDRQALTAVFRIACYSIILWLPLVIYVPGKRFNLSRGLRSLALIPVIALAVITLFAAVLWWR